MTHHKAAGTAVGTLLGFIESLELFAVITWQTIWETAVITIIGGICGFIGSELTKLAWTGLKLLWAKIKPIRK